MMTGKNRLSLNHETMCKFINSNLDQLINTDDNEIEVTSISYVSIEKEGGYFELELSEKAEK